MVPVVALIGRPNVGKSTLFNRLTKSRDALVADLPGLTRDRQYGHAQIQGRPFIIIDTGGITGGEVGIDGKMAGQSKAAVDESDIVLFIVDGRAGLTGVDESLAQELRASGKSVHLVVNKIDGIDLDQAMADFYALGFDSIHAIAAAHGRGVSRLSEELLVPLSAPAKEESEEEARKHPKLAIIGRPNVGKSTLVNRMLGEDRVVVYDLPGTTRDSIYIEMERMGKNYTLIDTAGVRKRGKVKETVEKFSILKTLQAIEDANVCVMVFDAREGLTEQDLNLLGFTLDAGRSIVIAINKWDGMEQEAREKIKDDIKRRLIFADFARIHFISALHGSGVGDLFGSVDEAYRSANVEMSSSKLTRTLEIAVAKHSPPMVRGFRIKLRYAHPGGHNPPRIVIHGNQTSKLPESYQRYLMKHFRKALNIMGTPIKFELKEGDNPYKGKKQEITRRQRLKRRRTIKKFGKKKK
ncbi:ribosome biogenesis GTPase Der [Pleionea sp. CnH1-48]|uniref:ribosome biogenesis GTPase Der n=1 Tax=Pleionea sp. CnH1-48 TaxID=2954494 RepID=UPI002097597B|nr:ribosome biogenesis GTPase Der [Pleionea sp. CnH1-48]MCO7227445.1 ribosome biogenesis GTPase Der [Pleionea sp. CnH1-48]